MPQVTVYPFFRASSGRREDDGNQTARARRPTGMGTEVGFLDDLFVDPYRRGDAQGSGFSGKSLKLAAGAWFGGSRTTTITGQGACMIGRLEDLTGLPTR